MPRIYVQFAGLDQIGAGCQSVASKVDTIESEFMSTIRVLDWDVRSSDDVNSTAKNISRKLEQQTKALKTYQQFIDNAYAEYTKLDAYKAIGQVTSAAITATVATDVETVEEKDGIFSVGKKLFKTATTLGKAALAAVGCAASWTTGIGSGGLGIPLAAMGTVYAANTLTSCFSDIGNLWWGDESKVGEVNLLKDTAADFAGDITESLGGNREVGEFIGKCVYGAGELVVNVNNARSVASVLKGETNTVSFVNEIKEKLLSKSPLTLRGKIIQNDTSFDTVVKAVKEIPTAVSGLKDIAFNSPLSSVVLDYKLLSFQIENLTDVAGMAELVKEVGDFTTDVATNIVEMVMPT